MTGTLDLFTITAPTQPDAIQRQPEHIRRAAAVTACARPWSGKPQHQCSIGGGDAAYSRNSGKTWECDRHVTPDFYAYRKRA